MEFKINAIYENRYNTMKIKIIGINKKNLSIIGVTGYKKSVKRLLPKCMINGIMQFWFIVDKKFDKGAK